MKCDNRNLYAYNDTTNSWMYTYTTKLSDLEGGGNVLSCGGLYHSTSIVESETPEPLNGM